MAPKLPKAPWGVPLGLGGRTASLQVELFLDMDCPFSVNMGKVIFEELQPKLKESKMDVEFLFINVPQPWHPQSCVMHEMTMAALLYDQKNNTQTFWPYAMAMMNARDANFRDMQTAHMSRLALQTKLLDILEMATSKEVREGVALEVAATGKEPEVGEVTQMMKFAAKYHRVRSVHVTPTVFMNGMEAGDISSGWTAEQWLEKLSSVLA